MVGQMDSGWVALLVAMKGMQKVDLKDWKRVAPSECWRVLKLAG